MTNNKDILKTDNFFFIGVGGVGMSAIAQYLSGRGKNVAGSDRAFANADFAIKNKLEDAGIQCFIQDGSGINSKTQIIVVSTAVEESNIEYQKAKALNITIVHRSEMLSAITDTQKTVAVAGTSGKSTTVAMLFHILHEAGLSPSLISGAGLVALEKKGLIGNAIAGNGEWLIIEADESDGSLINYKPEIGLILNIDKDHKELSDLEKLFATFASNVKDKLIVNRFQPRTKKMSADIKNDFGPDTVFYSTDYEQKGFSISFRIAEVEFNIPVIGKFNMENALAAIGTANKIGVSLQQSADALKTYMGIHRRQQFVGKKHDVTIIDDYAHNPIKVASSIRACYSLGKRLIAWFQPHGFGPTRFLRNDFVEEISSALRKEDEIWMSEIYYAGGTVKRDISAADLISDIEQKGSKAIYIEDRKNLPAALRKIIKKDDVLLLMGARDPSLNNFASYILQQL